MSKTCIICGNSAGSGEHVFPAALGGRRTNKGIYCGTHDNAYSGLAGIIADQMSFFNAQLGVIKDHSKTPVATIMTDVASGREMKMTASHVQFKEPQTISEKVEDAKTYYEMAFNSHEEANAWIDDQKAKGVNIITVSKGTKEKFHVGTLKKEITLGGTEEGLRAIGYIAQTFLAQSFADIARLPEMKEFKDYTLRNIGSGFVWWDFEPPNDLPANHFSFGHRIIVGVNKNDNTAFARISLFSTLHFAILFGSVPVGASRTVITDIDPLAKSPPDDIYKWSKEAVVGAVSKPETLTANLAAVIKSGKAQKQIHELLQRIEGFKLTEAAETILGKLHNASTLSKPDRDKLFTDVVSSMSQRVIQLIQAAAKNCKERAYSDLERGVANFLEKSVEFDPASTNGLTVASTQYLAIASDALAKKMVADFEAGTLDQDRMEMLIGGGLGMQTVSGALAVEFAKKFKMDSSP